MVVEKDGLMNEVVDVKASYTPLGTSVRIPGKSKSPVGIASQINLSHLPEPGRSRPSEEQKVTLMQRD